MFSSKLVNPCLLFRLDVPILKSKVVGGRLAIAVIDPLLFSDEQRFKEAAKTLDSGFARETLSSNSFPPRRTFRSD